MMLPPASNDYTTIEERVNNSKMKPSQSVSVVIPFYKGASYLEKSLASLSNQTYPKNLIEVIIVQDDGCEDINMIYGEFAKQLQLKLIKIKRIGYTPCRLRNAGIRNARGDVIFSIDFDIICPPETVEDHMKWFHVSDRVATFGLRKFVDVSNIPLQEMKFKKDYLMALPDITSISNTIEDCRIDKRLPEVKIIKSHPFPCNCFHGCNIAYRRDTAMKVGLWDEDFDFYYGREDMEFGHRLWKNGTFLIYEPKATVLHQENSIVTKSQKEIGLNRNLNLLRERVPGIIEFRENMLVRLQKSFGL